MVRSKGPSFQPNFPLYTLLSMEATLRYCDLKPKPVGCCSMPGKYFCEVLRIWADTFSGCRTWITDADFTSVEGKCFEATSYFVALLEFFLNSCILGACYRARRTTAGQIPIPRRFCD
jgi:hypothetical protein